MARRTSATAIGRRFVRTLWRRENDVSDGERIGRLENGNSHGGFGFENGGKENVGRKMREIIR